MKYLQQLPLCLLLLLWVLAVLTGCTPKPPDVPACEQLSQTLGTDPTNGHTILKPSPTCMSKINEPECGHCVYIVSGNEVFLGENKGNWLNGKPWSAIKKESVYLPAVESYAPVATYMIDACRKMNCSAQVDTFTVKLNSLNGVSDAMTQAPVTTQ